jgi:hypothetical protein
MNRTRLEVRIARKRSRIAWLVRFAVLGALLAVVGMPVGEVYSSTFPTIRKLHVEGNDLKWIKGVAQPNQEVGLWVRQRSFKEDDRVPPNFNCPGNTTEFVQYTNAQNADANGNWLIDGLDLMVMPPGTGKFDCNAALLTEFIVGVGASEANVPDLRMFNIPEFTMNDPESWLEAESEGADEVAVSVTDGPDDEEEAVGGMDMDEDGIDLCEVPGFTCGQRVTYLGSGGTFVSPAIVENDSTVFALPEPIIDDEYPFILSMAEAHASGGSFLAATRTRRYEDPLSPSINVNVNVKADLGVDLCSNGGLFDFF